MAIPSEAPEWIEGLHYRSTGHKIKVIVRSIQKVAISKEKEKYVYETLTNDELERIKLDLLLAEESSNEEVKEIINQLEEKLLCDKFAHLLNASQERSSDWEKERFLAWMSEMAREILEEEKRVFIYSSSSGRRMKIYHEN